MRVGSLFSGIGGMDLGLERAGMQIAWQVENDPFRQAVLAKHWPEAKRYGDIRELNPTELEPVDLICGGFPCQPFSVAGKRRGKADDRYLWPEMLRIIKALRPRWVLGENVANIVNLALDTVLSDLENEGYETGTFVIPACAVGAPHRRDRVWIVGHAERIGCSWEPRGRAGKIAEDGYLQLETRVVAYAPSRKNNGRKRGHLVKTLSEGESLDSTIISSSQNVAHTQGAERQRAGAARGGRAGLADGGEDVADTDKQGLQGHGRLRECTSKSFAWPSSGADKSAGLSESCLGRVPDGPARRLDRHRWPAPLGCEQYGWEPPRLAPGGPYRRHRLMALGDAVVPQVVEVIGRAIMATDERR